MSNCWKMIRLDTYFIEESLYEDFLKLTKEQNAAPMNNLGRLLRRGIEVTYKRYPYLKPWEPIESAPKNGEILALIQGCDSKKYRRVVLSYDEFQEEWRFDGSKISNAWTIVGWKYLPDVPEINEEK